MATQPIEQGSLAVSTDDAARALGCSKRTILRLLDDGALKSVLILRRRLIPVSELHRLIDRGGYRREQ